MCFHNSLFAGPEEIGYRYGRIYSDIAGFEPVYHVSAFNYPEMPVVTRADRIGYYRWGLIPSWVGERDEADEIRLMTLNLRSEVLADRPFTKQALEGKRCLIPSTGWFDWKQDYDRKIPYMAMYGHQKIFSIAGLYDSWVDMEDGTTLHSFAVLTAPAGVNFPGERKASRIPVVIPYDMEERWLDVRTPLDQVLSMIKAPQAREISTKEIRGDFMKFKATDERVLEPEL